MATSKRIKSVVICVLILGLVLEQVHVEGCPCESEINLRLYLHQIYGGEGVNQQVAVRPSSETLRFGTIVVIDWTVLDGPKPDATIVARTKGMQVHADVAGPGWFNYFSMVFENTRYNGSSFVAMGINADAKGEEGQMAIIGGTGEFAMARGIIKYRSLGMATPTHRVKELNIHAFYVKPAPAGSFAGAAIE